MAAFMARMGGQMPRGMMQMMGQRGRVSITILDERGKFISQLNGPDEKGLNRVYWNFRETERPTGQEQAQTEERGAAMFFGRGVGTTALPGKYTVKVKYEDQEASQTVEVKTDPRFKIDIEVLKANYEKGKQAQNLSRVIMQASRQLQQTQRSIQTVKDNLRMSRIPKAGDIRKAADELEKKLKELTETLSPTPAKQGMADRSSGLQSQVMSAVRGITGAGYEPVSQAAQVEYDKVKPKVEDFLTKVNDFYQKDVEAFKKLLKDTDFSLFAPFTPLKID
jgi:hypothetical protein